MARGISEVTPMTVTRSANVAVMASQPVIEFMYSNTIQQNTYNVPPFGNSSKTNFVPAEFRDSTSVTSQLITHYISKT